MSTHVRIFMLDGMGTLNLSAMLARRIDQLGLSQRAYAERIGISPQHLSGILKGKIVLPGPETRRRLAADLGLSHLDLLVLAGELNADEVATGETLSGGAAADDPAEEAARRLRALTRERVREALDYIAFLEHLEERRRRAAADTSAAITAGPPTS